MGRGVNEVVVNELSIQFKNLGLINECINDVRNALVDVSKVYKEEQKNLDEAYQRGLTDAWECMKKIAFLEKPRDMRDFFGHITFEGILNGYTATEAIEKLKAYEEQKADDEIKVGDEVAFHHDDRPDTVVVVTYIGQDGFIDGMDGRGTQYAHKNPAKWTKTGRHFDIDKILEEMRHES